MNNDQSRGSWTSASNAEADLLCPGRFLAQTNCPEDPGSEDAAFGIALHSAIATGDVTKLDVEQQDLHESCVKIIDNVGEQVFGPHWPEARCRAFSEQRYWAQFKNGSGTVYKHSGQCDRVYRHSNKALVIEIKSLAGDVPGSPENMQLRDQAVLVKGHFLVDQVATVVVQPYVTHSPKVCVYEKADLVRAEAEMFQRIVKAHDPASPRIAGEAQCKFCRARLKCSQYQKWAGSSLPVPASILDVPVTEWTGEQCAQFLAQKAVAQKWLDDAYNAMKARLEKDQGAIPGYQLKPGAEKGNITDAQALFSRFEVLGGKLEQFMECLTVGKTRFKAAVNAVTGKKGKALESLIKTMGEGITETKRNSPSIERTE